METVGGLGEVAGSSSFLLVGERAPIGRGVYARKDFQPGDLIETAPVIVIPADQWQHLEKTILFSYCYAFGENCEDMALALGFGSLYNHSYTPNAKYLKRLDHRMIEYHALQPIRQGEEITINYNGNPDCLDPLWFPVLK